MASKATGTNSSTRIRDNQRRSRAKRAEHLATLQQRIHEYERRDAVATVEMQRAAQAVARENAVLRRMLARHGVSPAEIAQELCVVRDGAMSSSSGSMEMAKSDRGPRATELGQQKEKKRVMPVPTGTELREEITAPLGPFGHDPIPHDSHDPINFATSPAQPASHVSPSSLSAAETSCIAAATIIAQMRGDGDADFARAMLGCDGTMDCRVKNTTVFQVLDGV